MSFPKYPNYKPSGVEWLGDVPEHWEVSTGRRLFAQTREPARHTDEQLSATQKYGVIPQAKFMELEDQKVTLALSGLDNFKHVNINDFVISLRSFQGGIEHSSFEGCVSPAYTILSPGKDVHPPFWKYLLKSSGYIESLQSVTDGIRDGKNVSYAQFGSVCIPKAPFNEQTLIASFLDRETSKIDSLVAEQRRLIELLKEKRQAVISHAVTKGLNPHAPMKPSGIEWLGDVPEHWEVVKGSAIGALFGSEQVPDESVSDEGDLPFIKVSSMSLHSFEIESWDWYVDAAVAQQCNARAGYVVFPKRGAAIFTNKVNIVDRPSMIDPNLMGWEIGPKAVPKFMAYTLKCRKLDELADVSTVPQINNKHIAPERFPIPPLNEQSEIVEFLGTETAKLDALTGEVERAIELLQERRTALISAAVTGKIDVRNWVEAN